ncbi:MAG TPA: hypothetical protein VFY06_12755 [Verrucomicrobiae bacterium]|nr:hypothetical protein [Verrucomicrobiae bacterium]
MKTKILVLGAVVTAFALTSFATEPLLAPRAKGNQIKVVTSSVDTQGGTVTYVTPVASAPIPPRAQENQIKMVKGTNNDSNAALACQKNMVASPKVVQNCIENGNMRGCVTVAPLK